MPPVMPSPPPHLESGRLCYLADIFTRHFVRIADLLAVVHRPRKKLLIDMNIFLSRQWKSRVASESMVGDARGGESAGAKRRTKIRSVARVRFRLEVVKKKEDVDMQCVIFASQILRTRSARRCAVSFLSSMMAINYIALRRLPYRSASPDCPKLRSQAQAMQALGQNLFVVTACSLIHSELSCRKLPLLRSRTALITKKHSISSERDRPSAPRLLVRPALLRR